MLLKDRLRLLNARAGGLSRKECVMPIDLVYEPYENVGLWDTMRLFFPLLIDY